MANNKNYEEKWNEYCDAVEWYKENGLEDCIFELDYILWDTFTEDDTKTI